ncbi:MAG: aromatic aminobenezylarsenical efflux permease ArsG family transporter [Candidatus Nanoarchaeia archaeon]|nr:aromatic aminobenezylarsenical efflux permease ArsG family transporter [Candidatus Nanoarchaeia archaeon]
MGLMAFMEAMGTSGIPIVAAFFIGLMTAISPCPLATNITAIAYASKRISHSRHTLLVGFLYTLGRMFTYVGIASLIVFFGINTQEIALFLQKYGEKILGPFLIIIGVVMLDAIKLNIFKENGRFSRLKENLANKGYAGAFLLGVVFAMAFCPFSAVLFFGMLIPLAIKAQSAILLPSVFAFATGLPVIVFSFILVKSVNKLGAIMNKVQTFELWMRKIMAVVFILAGLYYTIRMVV